VTPKEKAVVNAARFLCRDFGRITISHTELMLRLHGLARAVEKLEQRRAVQPRRYEMRINGKALTQKIADLVESGDLHVTSVELSPGMWDEPDIRISLRSSSATTSAELRKAAKSRPKRKTRS